MTYVPCTSKGPLCVVIELQCIYTRALTMVQRCVIMKTLKGYPCLMYNICNSTTNMKINPY